MNVWRKKKHITMVFPYFPLFIYFPFLFWGNLHNNGEISAEIVNVFKEGHAQNPIETGCKSFDMGFNIHYKCYLETNVERKGAEAPKGTTAVTYKRFY